MKLKNLKYAFFSIAALLSLKGYSKPSAAYSGYSSVAVNLRAGPGREYPVVARITGGAEVNIMGCVGGWTWCDVAWGGTRGWVSGRYLRDEDETGIVDYGPQVGIPIVTFQFGPYWDHYYRGRPFYGHWHGGGGHGGHWHH